MSITSFSDLTAKIIKGSNDGVSLEDFKKNVVKKYIHTGSYLLNIHLSGSLLHGLPCGEVVSIAGDPKTGKSFVALNVALNAVLDGFVVFYLETEGSPVKDRLVQSALNTNYRQYNEWVNIFLKSRDEEYIKLCKKNNEEPVVYNFHMVNQNYFTKSGKINVTFLKEIFKEQYDRPVKDDMHIKYLAAYIKSLEIDDSINEKNMKNLIKYDFTFYRLVKAVIIERPETVEDVIEISNRILGELLVDKKKAESKANNVYESPNIYIILDSYNGLNTRAQYENAEGEKGVKTDMGTFAKRGKELLNMVAIRCDKLGVGWLNTVHIYEKDMGNFRKRHPSGGNGPIYLSAILPMLKKSIDKDKETKERKGILVTSEIFESRHSKMTEIEFYISFVKGMNPYYGLDNYVGWHICGIDKGRFDDFADLANEMILKKLLTKENFLTKEFSLDDFKKNLSKAKAEALDGHIEVMMDNDWLVSTAPMKYKFTEKLFNIAFQGDKYEKVGSDLKSVVLNPNSSKWVIKHLGVAMEKKDTFTHEVYSIDVLRKLDEHMKPLFQFGSQSLELDNIINNSAKDVGDLAEFTL